MSQKIYSREWLLAHARFGPGIIGEEAAAQAAALSKATGGGKLGPALVDPEPSGEPSGETSGPTGFTALTNAALRELAESHGLEIKGNPKKADLVQLLVDANVPVPTE